MNKRALGPIAMVVAAAICVGAAVSLVKSKQVPSVEGTYTPGTYTAEAQGFGGPVTVELTTDGGSITDVKLTGGGETPDIGGAALPQLVDQILTVQSTEIDGVAGATLTSNGVREALVAAIAQAKGEPIPTPEPTPEPTPAPVIEGGETFTGKGQGFGGEVVAELTMKDGKIEAVSLTGENETPGIGGAALPTLSEQIMAAQSEEIDGVSGATLTSNGIREAVGKALAASRGEEIPEPTPEPTPEPIEGGEVITGTGKGFGGTVTAELTMLDGKIAAVNLTGSGETPAIGGAAMKTLASQVMSAQGPKIDGVSGATLTSNGVREAVAKALGVPVPTVEATPTPEPTPEPPVPAGAEVLTGSGQGFGGTVTAKLTMEDGKITNVSLSGSGETPSIGGAALGKLADQVKAAQGPKIDGVSGATLTSNGVKEAVAKAMGVSVPGGSKPEPTPEPTPAEPAKGEVHTGSGQGFGGSITAEVTMDGGKITDVKLSGSGETPAIGGAALSKLADQVKAAQGPNIDGVSGATLTSNGVKEAVAKAMGVSVPSSKPEPTPEPAPEPTPEPAPVSKTYNAGTYTGSAQGFGGAVTATVTVSDDAITDVKLTGDGETPGIGAAALEPLAASAKAKGAGLDAVSGATVTSNAAKEAVSAALSQAKP